MVPCSAFALRTLCILVLTASLSACVTERQVARIVDTSNAALQADAMLQESDLPRLDVVEAYSGSEGGLNGAEWTSAAREPGDATIARIDEFIARHGQNPALEQTVNALRLRKAVLLLVAGRTNLARAAFAEFNPSLAGNARDLALYRSYPALAWWWDVAGEWVEPRGFAADASTQVRTLDTAIASTPPGSAIRYYLATVRAHVYLKWASTETDRRPRLQEGLARFSEAFDPPAREHVAAWSRADTDALKSVPTENLRWYGHARIVFAEYARVYGSFLDETWQAFQDDPESLDPGLRSLCSAGKLEREPVWPDEASWLVQLA